MAAQKKVVRYFAGLGVVASMALTAGCGGSDPAPVGPSGQVIQGPVSGARVFADKKLAGSAFGNFVIDADEAATQTVTNGQGGYTLPVAPGYDYVIVAQSGGVDTITGVTSMQLIAPAGARNVTPLTTIVALQPTVKSKIESLGVSFDDNIATNATPAALLLVKSIETVVATLTETLNSANNLSTAQVNDIQAKAVAAIAAEIVKPATTVGTLTTVASLQSAMTTAITSALTDIDSTSSNITVSNAAAVASSCAGTVTSVANAINAGGTFAVTGTASEAAIFTPAIVTQIETQVEQAVTNNATNVTVTPTPVTPPATGSTGGTGGSGVGGNF